MSHPDPNHLLLYLSSLAPAHDFSVYRSIVNAARRYNVANGVHGALLFDGERFCQLLVGPAAAVLPLVQRIRRDPRHTDLIVLHADTSAALPVWTGWRSGYCEVEALDALAAPAGPRGEPAVAAFLAVVAAADLSD